MPKQKDFKRLVRARMTKTGESYTAARAHVLAADTTVPARSHPPLPDDYETLAGMSDAAVLKATGMNWPDWTAWLDDAEAATLPHREIAALLDDSFEIGGWWAQMVTVSYERFRGLRDVGQRRGGGYDANRSRTVPVGVEALWAAFADEAVRGRWLPPGAVDFHHENHPKSMRGTAPDGTKVDVYFTAKDAAKSSVSIQHRDLPDREAADAAKALWSERLDALKAVLTPGT